MIPIVGNYYLLPWLGSGMIPGRCIAVFEDKKSAVFKTEYGDRQTIITSYSCVEIPKPSLLTRILKGI